MSGELKRLHRRKILYRKSVSAFMAVIKQHFSRNNVLLIIIAFKRKYKDGVCTVVILIAL
jgi:hypothetical protein